MPQEAVASSVRVVIVAGDFADVIVGIAECALAGGRGSALNVKRRDFAVRSAHEAVIYAAGVKVPSGDGTEHVEGRDKRPLAGPCAAPVTSNVVRLPLGERTKP